MKEDLLNEIEDLRDVIAWSHENGGLTVGQRIMLHQHIAKLMKVLSELEEGIPSEIAVVDIPTPNNEKVKHILRVIQNTNWEKKEFKY
ncbi:hypothetical protein INR75_02955 [Zunongwangia sp. SCSIO 43204]|uniref:hypothetical protein n=1 Tax=Zunongwangia sp. SCSIO 43204 TaxID=2779359 RepID=UPI001CA90802|nr:hypothetical protein [Zunongwangia sp. SCSIO 43204]UAB85006.1 hypothetical protein INR75_02955 [Zunongwangia sp. SCSIO 43204]